MCDLTPHIWSKLGFGSWKLLEVVNLIIGLVVSFHDFFDRLLFIAVYMPVNIEDDDRLLCSELCRYLWEERLILQKFTSGVIEDFVHLFIIVC